jgi:putative photosynthetic complex assembly protein
MPEPAMSATHSHDISLPRVPLVAMAVLVVLTIVAVAVYRQFAPVESIYAPTGTVVVDRAMRFEDRADGGITVRGVDGEVLHDIPPGADPFLRGALRALVRERRSLGIGAQAPFRLVAWASGRLTLIDTGTQRRLDLESFGPTQTAAFARLLDLPHQP